MTDNTGLTDVAAAWVAALTARGVTLRSRGPRGLEMLPKSAYSAMSPEERASLKKHRAEIVAVVREQYGGLARGVVAIEPRPEPEPESAPAPKSESEPTPCRFCYRPSSAACAALRAERPDVWQTLHSLDPAEVERRREEQRADDADLMHFLNTGIPTERMRVKAEAARPRPTDEQIRQAELRKRLGWDAGVLNEQRGYRYRE